jgi:hypothetical protein
VNKSLKWEGFIAYQYQEREEKCYNELAKLVKEGKLKLLETVLDGFDKVPEVRNRVVCCGDVSSRQRQERNDGRHSCPSSPATTSGRRSSRWVATVYTSQGNTRVITRANVRESFILSAHFVVCSVLCWCQVM